MFRLLLIAMITVGFLNPACCCVLAEMGSPAAQPSAAGCCGKGADAASSDQVPNSPGKPCGDTCGTQFCGADNVRPAPKTAALALNPLQLAPLNSSPLAAAIPAAASDLRYPPATTHDGPEPLLWQRYCRYLL